MPRLFLLVLALLLSPVAYAQGQGSASLVKKFEERVLAARKVRVEARIVASGAVEAALTGHTVLQDRNRSRYAYSGTFNGARVDLAWESDGQRFTIRNGEQQRGGLVSVATSRALALGLTRMGLLHNIARGTSLDAPDHDFGGVEKWITLDGFLPTTFAQSGDLAGLPSLGFDLMVNGQRSASVRLWLDPVSQLPTRREQVVEFAAGEMRVVETYTGFIIE